MGQRIAEERIKSVRACLPAYLHDRGITNLRRKFCCLSASHNDRHPSMSYKADLQIVHCFSCNYTRNVIGLYADEHGLDERKDFLHIIQELEKRYLGVSHPTSELPNSYLLQRGLSAKTIQHFRVQEHESYQMGKIHLKHCITIPYSFEENPYIIARLTGEKKFFKPENIAEPIFHVEELDQTEPVVIVESAICAMSVWQSGYRSIALNGTGYSRLLDYLNAKQGELPLLILCLDQDEAGQRTQQRLHEALMEAGISHRQVLDLKGKKDPNELLCVDSGEEILHTVIQDVLNEQAAPDPMSLSAILNTQLHKWLNEDNQNRFYSGLESLDRKMGGGLSSQFYLIGGIPSSGKTSFLLQLAIAFAKQRRHVLYLSYESSIRELIYKALSLISTEIDRPFSASDILRQDRDVIDSASSALDVLSPYLHLDESRPDMTEIEKKLCSFNEQPILLIDYLQIVPVKNTRLSDKEKMDELVTWLYRYTKENRIPTFVISSFNRNSYYGGGGLDAYKESGALEYSADVIFTLQLRVFSEDPVFQSDHRLAERKKKIEDECRKEIREMELFCQKNRYGEAWFKVPLDFHVKYSLFLEANVSETRAELFQAKSLGRKTIRSYRKTK